MGNSRDKFGFVIHFAVSFEQESLSLEEFNTKSGNFIMTLVRQTVMLKLLKLQDAFYTDCATVQTT